MRKIKLTQGKYALIDDDDYQIISLFNWHVNKIGKNYRAFTIIWDSETKTEKKLSMSRFIMKNPKNKEIDHINHNTLDNRKSNLRACNKKQNCQNRPPNSNSTSKYKGVHWCKTHKKWKATMKLNNKSLNLGSYDYEITAAQAYNFMAKEKYGEYAYLNQV